MLSHTSPSEIRMILSRPTDERFHCLFDAFRQNFTLDEIVQLTSITPFFLEKIKNIVGFEMYLATHKAPRGHPEGKKYGFPNAEIAKITGKSFEQIENCRSSFVQNGGHLCRRVPGQHAVFLFHQGTGLRDSPSQTARKFSSSDPAPSGSVRELNSITALSMRYRHSGRKVWRSILSITTPKPSPRISTLPTGSSSSQCSSRMS
jgi:hypothetical protein